MYTLPYYTLSFCQLSDLNEKKARMNGLRCVMVIVFTLVMLPVNLVDTELSGEAVNYQTQTYTYTQKTSVRYDT